MWILSLEAEKPFETLKSIFRNDSLFPKQTIST